jgi:hypothetical protein
VSATAPFWRSRLLPAALALLGVNLVVLAAWTGPRYWRQKNAATRAQVARAEVERRRQAVAGLRERAAAIRENGADVERFYRSLAGAERTDLLPTLEAIEDLAVTLPLEGSYEQLVGFLREVEASPRFLTVDRVAMRADQEGAPTLQVELSTYVRKPAEPGREGRGGR